MKHSGSKRPKALSPIERFLALSDKEKEAEYERAGDLSLDKTKPLSSADRKLWERAKRKVGRPVKGQGHKVISLSIEQGLLSKVDALAKRRNLTRAEIIARSLKSMLKGAA